MFFFYCIPFVARPGRFLHRKTHRVLCSLLRARALAISHTAIAFYMLCAIGLKLCTSTCICMLARFDAPMLVIVVMMIFPAFRWLGSTISQTLMVELAFCAVVHLVRAVDIYTECIARFVSTWWVFCVCVCVCECARELAKITGDGKGPPYLHAKAFIHYHYIVSIFGSRRNTPNPYWNWLGSTCLTNERALATPRTSLAVLCLHGVEGPMCVCTL